MRPHIQVLRSVPVSVVFPEINHSYENIEKGFDTFIRLLGWLSRTDTLFWCARLNLILSSSANDDEISKQQHFLDLFLTSAEISRINKFCADLGRDKNAVRVIARGQILEMIRWVSLYCVDSPNDKFTFDDATVRSRFAQALLIAGDLWAHRVYKGKLSHEADSMDEAKAWAMPSIRLSVADNSTSMDLWRIIARGRMIFNTVMAENRPSFASDFQAQTKLSLDDYYIYLSLMKVDFCDISKERLKELLHSNRGCGAFNIHDIMRQANLPEDARAKFWTYIQLDSQTPTELRESLWGTCRDINTTQARERFDYTPLRTKPILRAEDGRIIVLDPVFFGEKASPGPIFHVSAGTTSGKRTSYSLFVDFGKAFEDYCGRNLASMYPSSLLVKRLSCPLIRANSRDEIIDACLNDVTEAVFFEMKGVFLADSIIECEDSNQYIELLNQKYVRDGKKAKGVGQLARAIDKVSTKEWTAIDQDFSQLNKIYPVLVVHDRLLTSPGHSEYLAGRFVDELSPDSKMSNNIMIKNGILVAPLTVMLIDDLEDLESSVNYFSLRDLLCDYSRDCPERNVPLRQYVADSAKYKFRLNMGMVWETKRTLKDVIRRVFGVAPDSVLPSEGDSTATANSEPPEIPHI